MFVLHLLTAPDAVQVATVGGYRLGAGRTVPTTAAVLALIGVVVAGVALARPARRTGPVSGRVAALAGLVLGLVGAVVGGLHAANSAGGLGTGNGLAGAVVALVLGLVGVVVAALALFRSRRTLRPATPPVR
ncbi:DUF6223 family protein [Pseudonocardia lutea]|jgi:hypothetical protein|uniref:DUF6223 family protein n=1 Tax=Pseudonocardia lutea TaxID=2172015 RepID=A0ABW1I5R9_9PSEU